MELSGLLRALCYPSNVTGVVILIVLPGNRHNKEHLREQEWPCRNHANEWNRFHDFVLCQVTALLLCLLAIV